MSNERQPLQILKDKVSTKSILKQQEVMAENMREFVKTQVEIWRQIPNWALEAEGHSGYSDNSQRAYYYNIYPVSEGKYGYEGCIDLKTGDLIYHPWDASNDKKRKLSDEAILKIDPKRLDAKKLLAMFKKQAESEYFGGYNPRKISQWRADIRVNNPFLQETLDKKLTLQYQEEKLKSAICAIEKLSWSKDSELTKNQVTNAINHVLRASDYDDRDDGKSAYSPVHINIKGSHEIMQCVSFYIDLKSKQFAPLFANFSNAIWHSAVSVAEKVRKERGLIHHEEPEQMYKLLGEEYTKRAGGNAYMFAEPPKQPLKMESAPATIADWFIDSPAV